MLVVQLSYHLLKNNDDREKNHINSYLDSDTHTTIQKKSMLESQIRLKKESKNDKNMIPYLEEEIFA